MKLLVTGGAGFIGSNFILYWMKHHPEDQIVNLDLLTYAGNLENLKEVENNSNYSFVQADICDKTAVEKVMDGVDIVVHFAAESHVDRSIMDPTPFIKTNVLGTGVLLQAALNHKVKRFHHISTDEVYGALELNSQDKFTEQTPYNPHSPYSASKAGSDHLVRAFYDTYGLPVTITNCANNYGPFMFPEKLIPLSITNILEGKKIPIYGDGLYVRDWLYVEDHCSGIETVLQKGTVGETYLIGSMHQDVPNIEIAKRIVKLMGKDENSIEFIKDRPGHDRRYAIDWTKIHTQLGWSPQYEFDQALQKTIQWYIDNQDWWKRVKTGQYQEFYKKQYA